ncbi:hypothetical protein L7F22_015008 [Adiantum nelumboides]|nr:hypothetical protein [Adiantum nelumboides]
MALTFATRFNAVPVLIGITIATSVTHLVSVAVGYGLGASIPTGWISLVAAVAFLGFGAWTLRGDSLSEDEEAKAKRAGGSAVVAASVAFFLAELGDKTMLATITLAAQHGTLAGSIGIWAGSTVGMVAADGLAIVVGRQLGKRLPERAISIGAAVMFFVFGAWLLYEAVPQVWGEGAWGRVVDVAGHHGLGWAALVLGALAVGAGLWFRGRAHRARGERRLDVARTPGSPAWWARTLFVLAAVLGFGAPLLVALDVLQPISVLARPAVAVVGAGLLLLGFAVVAVAMLQLGTVWRRSATEAGAAAAGDPDAARRPVLATGGIYRRVRNPALTGLIVGSRPVRSTSPAWAAHWAPSTPSTAPGPAGSSRGSAPTAPPRVRATARPSAERPAATPSRRRHRPPRRDRGGRCRRGGPGSAGGSGVPGRLGQLVAQHPRPDLAPLVGDRVVQGVRADVAPEPVEAQLRGRRAGPEALEDPAGDLQRDLGGARLHRGDPHLVLAALLGGDAVGVTVDRLLLLRDGVGQRLHRPQLRVQVAVEVELVGLVDGALLAAVQPRAGLRAGVLGRGLQRPAGDAEVEVGEHELEHRHVERVVDPRLERLVDEPGGRRPRHGDVGDRDAAALGEALADVVPVVVECEAVLGARDDREDVLVRPLDDALQHGDVGDLAAGGERLGAVVDDLVAGVADGDVGVARVHRTAEEPLVAGRVGLDGGDLLGRADQTRGPEPEQVVAEQLADGAVARGDLADHPVGQRPLLSAAPVLDRPQDGDQAGVLEQGDLVVRGGARPVAGCGVTLQDTADVAGPGQPARGVGGRGGPVERLDGGGLGTVLGRGHDVSPRRRRKVSGRGAARFGGYARECAPNRRRNGGPGREGTVGAVTGDRDRRPRRRSGSLLRGDAGQRQSDEVTRERSTWRRRVSSVNSTAPVFGEITVEVNGTFPGMGRGAGCPVRTGPRERGRARRRRSPGPCGRCRSDGGELRLALGQLGLLLADDRQHLRAEVLDLLLEVQEAEQQQVRAAPLVLDRAVGDLLRGADQLGLEAVVVLDEVLERRVRPHALLVAGGVAGLLHGVAEALDGRLVGLLDDLAQGVPGLLLGVPGDHEAVEAEPDGLQAVGGLRVAEDLLDLLGEAVVVLAVGEVPVRDGATVAAGRGGVAALEDLRVRAAGDIDRAGLEVEAVHPVEVAGELGAALTGGPDLAQHADELVGAAVALVVLEPRLAHGGELVLEPAGDDVDGDPAVRQVVGGGEPLGQHGRLPQARVHGGDHLEPLGGQAQREGERGGLVLVVGAVAGHVADLAQRVLEAVVLGGLGQLPVVLEAPVGALLDGAGDQPAGDVGDPVRELQRLLDPGVGRGGESIGHGRLLGGVPGTADRHTTAPEREKREETDLR